MHPFNGTHRCNHQHCGKFGSYTLIEAGHGWFVYSCKQHRSWAYSLANTED